MEEKVISERESLELISQMIKNTKTNLGKGPGNDFLIWGYSCLITTAVVLTMAYVLHLQHAGWAYFLIPVLGIIASLVLKFTGKTASSGQATTYIAKSLKALYGSCSVVFAVYIAVAFFTAYNHDVWLGVFFLGCFVPSFCATVAGTLVRMWSINILGNIGMALSLVILAQFMTGAGIAPVPIACSIVVWLCTLVIPGHILNNEAKKELKK